MKCNTMLPPVWAAVAAPLRRTAQSRRRACPLRERKARGHGVPAAAREPGPPDARTATHRISEKHEVRSAARSAQVRT